MVIIRKIKTSIQLLKGDGGNVQNYYNGIEGV
jgi:hypothetical protein